MVFDFRFKVLAVLLSILKTLLRRLKPRRCRSCSTAPEEECYSFSNVPNVIYPSSSPQLGLSCTTDLSAVFFNLQKSIVNVPPPPQSSTTTIFDSLTGLTRLTFQPLTSLPSSQLPTTAVHSLTILNFKSLLLNNIRATKSTTSSLVSNQLSLSSNIPSSIRKGKLMTISIIDETDREVLKWKIEEEQRKEDINDILKPFSELLDS